MSSRYPILLFILILFSVKGVFGQFTKLYDLGAQPNGSIPYASPVSDGTFLYGVTTEGGANSAGTIYKVKFDGTGFTTLFDFNDVSGSGQVGSLFYDGTFLYGITRAGGSDGHGTIYKIKTDGSSFSKIFDFTYAATGAFPSGGLISDGTFLYGTTQQGGSKSYGTVFKIKPDGSAFATLLAFDGTANMDGAPSGNLYSDGIFLYGVTSGGAALSGSVFKVKTDGTGFAQLVAFTNTNGGAPLSGLISEGGFLFGTTSRGSTGNYGTIYKVKPDGTGFATVLNFSNTIGARPEGALVSDGTFLYGSTADFGVNFDGVIFKVKPDGTGFTKLADKDVANNGPAPEGTMILVGTTLYGVNSGLNSDFIQQLPGSVFRINTDGSGYSKVWYFEFLPAITTGALVSDGTFFYGMSTQGGLYNDGAIFKVRQDGTGFSNLFDFHGINGRLPGGSLITDGTWLYGTVEQGGANLNYGYVFKIKTDGSGFVRLHDFDNDANGYAPKGDLFSDGTYLYGMTFAGGTNSSGTIYKLQTDGTAFSRIFDFDGAASGYGATGSFYSDGTFLYGMTSGGGNAGSWGTIFKIKTDGSGYLKLLDFDYSNNGSNPLGSLIGDATSLYGMTSGGGANINGTIFKINKDGSGYTKLLDFRDAKTGSAPAGSLISDGTFLYGMTSTGGPGGNGTIFRIKTDGSGFDLITSLTEGANPDGNLLLVNSDLYGITSRGGDYNLGIIFKTTTSSYTTILSTHPAEGAIGTLTTVYGLNFDPTPANNTLTFNGTAATVISSSVDSLVAFIPPGTTTGPVTVNAVTKATSVFNFLITDVSAMFSGTVKNCDVELVPGYSGRYDDDRIQTFIPENPDDKVKAHFNSYHVTDRFQVFDGPDINSPEIALTSQTNPSDIVATGVSGDLTFYYQWDDEDVNFDISISCVSAGGDGGTLTVYNAVSPNGVNPTLVIENIQTLADTKQNKVNIFDRWQNQVWHGENYDNDAVVFKGVSDGGSDLPSGVYFYKIEFGSGRKKMTGYISLRRK